ncbi:Sodium channel modifier 1 [Apodemus speciosus]|uniref:Sodium channel modifier 1 n=1 Tax=Apodemus speciosus TaxID=105296 RepID=A0ABQ0ELB2_APOSI
MKLLPQHPASLISSGTSEFEDFIFLVAQRLGPRRPDQSPHSRETTFVLLLLLLLTELGVTCVPTSNSRDAGSPDILSVPNKAHRSKRRVGDLLASYIPEDEALMLRDGRFACAICPHRPVLDTLAMLTAHRAGKKHLSSLKLFYGRKQSGRGAEQNPRQQNEVKTGSKAEAPLLTQTRIITQNALHRAPHYNSCCRRKHSPGYTGTLLFRPGWPHTHGDPPVSAPRVLGVKEPDTPAPSVSSSPLPTPEVRLQSAEISKEPEPGERSDAQESAALPASAPMSPSKRRVLNHYLTLRSSGWVPDGRGRWIKDENAEFDSDEEEPPDLPLD